MGPTMATSCAAWPRRCSGSSWRRTWRGGSERGAARGRESAPLGATGTASGRSTPGSARSSCALRSSGPAPASRPSPRPGSPPRRRCSLRSEAGVDRRRLDAQARRPRAGDGARRPLQEPGLQAAPRDLRARGRPPHEGLGGRAALPVARRHLPRALRGWAHRVGRAARRGGGQPRRAARDRRAAHRPLASRDLSRAAFLEDLTRRGPRGVKRVVGATWQLRARLAARTFGP